MYNICNIRMCVYLHTHYISICMYTYIYRALYTFLFCNALLVDSKKKYNYM